MDTFPDIAAQHFRFLLDMGFRETGRASGQLKFESELVWVIISWTPFGGEVCARFGLRPFDVLPAGQLTDRDLLSMKLDVPTEELAPIVAFEEAALSSAVIALAEIMRDHAVDLLRGDRCAFAELFKCRTAQAEKLTKRMSTT